MQQWQSEMKLYAEVEQMYRDYQSEQVLLTTEMKLKEKKILFKRKIRTIFTKKIFWANGELYKKRQELIKPIQDRIFDALTTIGQ